MPTSVATLEWQPLFGHVPMFGLVVACVAVIGLSFAKGSGPVPVWLRVIRLIVFLVMLGLLFGPSQRLAAKDGRQESSLSLVFDLSASMSVDDHGDQSRWEHVRQHWLDQTNLDALAAHTQLKFYEFGESHRMVDQEALAAEVPDESATRLVQTLGSLVGTCTPGSSIVVIGDGRDFDAKSVAVSDIDSIIGQAQARRVVVHSSCIGDPSPDVDVVRVTSHLSATQVLRGQTLRAYVSVRRHATDKRRYQLNVHCGDETVDQRVIEFESGTSARVESLDLSHSVPVDDRSRQLHYVFSVTPVDGEAADDNHASHAFVHYVGRRIRVVLFEGQPYWDTKYLVRLLRHDPRIELTTVYDYGRGRTSVVRHDPGEDASVSLDRVPDVSAFDVVIFGRGLETMLDSAAIRRLSETVLRNGTGLLWARGQAFSSLDEDDAASMKALQPVEWDTQVLTDLVVTQTGESGRVGMSVEVAEQVTDQLPPVIAARRIRSATAAGVVLLEQRTADGVRMPALIWQHAGAGRVAAILSDGLWRWSFSSREATTGRAVYDGLMSNLVHWLAMGELFTPGARLSLTLSDQHPDVSDDVTVRITDRFGEPAQAVGRIVVVAPDDTVTELPVTVAEDAGHVVQTSYQVQQSGVHQVRVETPENDGGGGGGQSLYFVGKQVADEMTDTSPDHAFMSKIAQATGGLVVPSQEPHRLVDWLDEHAFDSVDAGKTDLQPAWNHPLVFAVLIGLLAVEWFGRRARGLS